MQINCINAGRGKKKAKHGKKAQETKRERLHEGP
jgi:hypothetical protein